MLIYDLGAQSSLWGHSDSGTGVNIIAIFSIEIIVTQSQCLFFFYGYLTLLVKKGRRKKKRKNYIFQKT